MSTTGPAWAGVQKDFEPPGNEREAGLQGVAPLGAEVSGLHLGIPYDPELALPDSREAERANTGVSSPREPDQDTSQEAGFHLGLLGSDPPTPMATVQPSPQGPTQELAASLGVVLIST